MQRNFFFILSFLGSLFSYFSKLIERKEDDVFLLVFLGLDDEEGNKGNFSKSS